MSFLLLAILSLFFTPIRSFIISLLFPEKNEKNGESPSHDQVAELTGSVWGRLSVFEHIEQGLKKNPDGLAVISMFQPADFLNELVSNNERALHQSSGDIYLYNRPLEQRSCLTLTYRQLHHASLKIAAGLLAEGVQPNSTMVMIIPNGAEYTILLWACVLLRITYVSLDHSLLDISGFTQLKQLLQTLKPQLVVAPDVSSGKFLQVAMSELQLPRPIQISLTHSGTAGWMSLVDIAAKAVKFPADESAIVSAARHDDPRRIHSIMFTSGTSGIPKGCPLLVSGMSHVLESQAWLIDNEAGIFAVQQPHNSRGIAPAQTLQTWKAGGAVVMTGQNFSIRDSLEAIKQFGATFIVLTPPMVNEMAVELAARPVDVRSVKRIQVGGDAVTKDIMVKCAALFPQSQICVNHGMTEGGGSFIWPFFKIPPSNIPFFGEICPLGMVAPGSSIRLWDIEKNCVAKRGQFGKLHISSPSIISHYLGGRSEKSFYNDSKGRWFNTGDIAIVDREGLVYILGRRKDLLKCASVPIMPAVIESSIQALTGAATIVVPVPHHVLGAEPFAVLSSFNGRTETQIKEHIRAEFGKDYALGGIASLKEIGMVEFPVNQTHKIIKSEIQAAVLDKFIKKRDRVY
uniref:Putative 4-coumarate--CoA ligase 5 n=1 Tax=Talaromyces marneffei PM1 TaxID=1077442 RepID=A0A093W0F4_TALMA